MNQVPDFKKMSQEELMAFWARYSRPSRKDAEALVGDRRPGFTNAASALANYACNMAVAMSCKDKGDATATACYEHAMRLSYERIPADLRW